MFFVYLLHSLKDGGFYVGYSEDLRRRVDSHMSGRVRSTKNRLAVKLVYYEAYTERADAKGRELFLKSGSGHRFINKQLFTYLRKNGNGAIQR